MWPDNSLEIVTDWPPPYLPTMLHWGFAFAPPRTVPPAAVEPRGKAMKTGR